MSEQNVLQSILAQLNQVGRPLSFEALRPQAECEMTPDDWTRAFDKEVMGNNLFFDYKVEDNNYSSLVFSKGTGRPRGGIISNKVDEVIANIINQLEFNQGMRGDWDPILPPAAIFEKHRVYATDETIALAFQIGFKEQLFRFMSRDRNNYLTVSLSETRWYTVMAVEHDYYEVYCFYVRAGSEAAAIAKAKERANGGLRTRLKLQSISPGRVAIKSIDDEDPVIVEELLSF